MAAQLARRSVCRSRSAGHPDVEPQALSTTRLPHYLSCSLVGVGDGNFLPSPFALYHSTVVTLTRGQTPERIHALGGKWPRAPYDTTGNLKHRTLFHRP